MQANTSANVRQRSARPATFGYVEVERALARVFDAEDVRARTFRARILHLRKSGLTPATPGRGSRIAYSFMDVAQLVVALVLTEYNFDPAWVARTLQRHWKRRIGFYTAINEILQIELEKKKNPRATSKDRIAVLRVRFLSAALERGLVEKPKEISLRSSPPSAEITFDWSSDGTHTIDFRDSPEQVVSPPPITQFCAFNLSRRIRDLQQALAAVTTPNE
jgi:hypothetical protein